MDNHKHHNTALKVNEGIEQPPSINDQSALRFINIKRKKLTADEFVEGILSQDRTILSKAITLVESSLPEHQKLK